MTVHCYEPEHRSGFLPPGTKHHSLCSPGLNVPPETFELRHQISVSYSRSAATVLDAVKTATATQADT